MSFFLENKAQFTFHFPTTTSFVACANPIWTIFTPDLERWRNFHAKLTITNCMTLVNPVAYTAPINILDAYYLHKYLLNAYAKRRGVHFANTSVNDTQTRVVQSCHSGPTYRATRQVFRRRVTMLPCIDGKLLANLGDKPPNLSTNSRAINLSSHHIWWFSDRNVLKHWFWAVA